MTDRVRALVESYRAAAGRMSGLPIVNPALEVEAVAFEPTGEHEIGVLVAPWFMNLVVLPGTDDWERAAQGDSVEWVLPAGRLELTVCRDEVVGTHLTAALFRAVTDFPDQDFARAVAEEVAASLHCPPEPAEGDSGSRLSRRALFTQLGSS